MTRTIKKANKANNKTSNKKVSKTKKEKTNRSYSILKDLLKKSNSIFITIQVTNTSSAKYESRNRNTLPTGIYESVYGTEVEVLSWNDSVGYDIEIGKEIPIELVTDRMIRGFVN